MSAKFSPRSDFALKLCTNQKSIMQGNPSIKNPSKLKISTIYNQFPELQPEGPESEVDDPQHQHHQQKLFNKQKSPTLNFQDFNKSNSDDVFGRPNSSPFDDIKQGNEKRLSQSFTPSHPSRFRERLSFFNQEDPDDSSEKDVSSFLDKERPDGSIVNSTFISQAEEARHTLESTGVNEVPSPFSKSLNFHGGMIGDIAPPSALNFKSSIFDRADIPSMDGSEESASLFQYENTSNHHEVSQILDQDTSHHFDRMINDSLMEQLTFPGSPSSYHRPSPLVKQSYSVDRSSSANSSHLVSPTTRKTSLTGLSSSSLQDVNPFSSPTNDDFFSSKKTSPHSSQDSISIDTLNRRLERSEETLHQYEKDLVHLQSENKRLEDSNQQLKKELDEERTRVVIEEGEIYELEQDRDLYKVEAEEMRKEIDDMLRVLKIRENTIMELAMDAAESTNSIQVVEEKYAKLQEEMTANQVAAQTELDKMRVELDNANQIKNELLAKVEFLSSTLAADDVKESLNETSTQSDFPPVIKSHQPISEIMIEQCTQTEDLIEFQNNMEDDLSALIVNKDMSLFNTFAPQSPTEGDYETLTFTLQSLETKLDQVRRAMTDIQTATMDHRQTITMKSHFQTEVERWVEELQLDMEKSSMGMRSALEGLQKEQERRKELEKRVKKPLLCHETSQTPTLVSLCHASQTDRIFKQDLGIQTLLPLSCESSSQTSTPSTLEEQVPMTPTKGPLLRVKKQVQKTPKLPGDLYAFVDKYSESVQDITIGEIVDPQVEVEKRELVNKGTQTKVLFELIDPSYTTKRNIASSEYAKPNTITTSLVQLLISLLCLLIGYFIYNMYEVIGFVRNVLRVVRESKVAIM